MFIENHVKDDDKELPLYINDIAKYYRPLEVLLEITRNSLCISKTDLEVAIGEPFDSGKEAFNDCAELVGIEKINRDARDRRGMICAELAGDFHLGYARQLTDKSSLLFDLAF